MGTMRQMVEVWIHMFWSQISLSRLQNYVWESCNYNTGKMIANRLHYHSKGVFWSSNFIFTQLGSILCLCLDSEIVWRKCDWKETSGCAWIRKICKQRAQWNRLYSWRKIEFLWWQIYCRFLQPLQASTVASTLI